MGDLEQIASEVRTVLERCASLRQKLGEDPAAGPASVLAGGLERAMLALEKAILEVEVALRGGSKAAELEDMALQPAGVERGESQSPEVSLAKTFAEIANLIERNHLVVDPQDYKFATKAAEILSSLPEAERSGEKGARLLVDCVRFLDALERDHPARGYEILAEAARATSARIADFLESSRGIVFVPDPRAGASSLEEARAVPGAKLVPFPSRLPKGQPLWLLKRGVRVGERFDPPELAVSAGEASAVLELVQGVSEALLEPREQTVETRKARAAAFKAIRYKLLPQLIGADEDKEATILRYVANAMQPLNEDGSLSNPIGRILSELQKRGFTQIPVRIGVPFDDSFSTSKFERRIVRSDKPKGTVVQLIQIGFLNRDRVVAQKAVVGVSGGPDV